MERPSERRGAARTAVVWEALQAVLDAPGAFPGEHARIVDIGGGTGGFAVRLGELGHEVLVVDPSPDALAALDRRVAEAQVPGLVHGIQGELADVGSLVDEADLVLCHGVLEIAGEPAANLAALAGILRPGGTLSLLVAQRHAAVIARAMAGHFAQARDLLDRTAPDGRTGHRFTHDELVHLVVGAGLSVGAVHAIRVFSDLVPGSLLDLEPGATHALVELEHAVAERPEYLPLATQLHLLATR